jgi:hypothetical protein
MPDLRAAAERYVASNGDPGAAPAFMRETLLGRESRHRGLSGLVRGWLGNAEHLWLWDYPAIEQELKAAGFVEVRRATFHDSGDAAFDAVEDAGRWEGQLGVDCRRPTA